QIVQPRCVPCNLVALGNSNVAVKQSKQTNLVAIVGRDSLSPGARICKNTPESMNTNSNVYLGEWYQKEADLNRQLVVSFFPSDNSVELVDLKTRKTFLRRTKVEELSENDFFIGAKLLIFGKQINILDYGDAKTRNKKSDEQLSFGLIKAEALLHVGEILTKIHKAGLGVRRLAMLKIDDNYSSMLKSVRSEASSLNYLMDCMPSQSFVVLEIIGNNAYNQYRELCGPESIAEAKQCAPNSFRGLYGSDVYCSRSPEEAANVCTMCDRRTINDCKRLVSFQESRFIFLNNDIKLVLRSSALYINSTLCIIKPHAVREGKAGEIITEILRQKFTVTAIKMLRFERPNCEEFLEVYKGVVPEYESMVMQMISGDCMALEITNKYDDTRSTYQSFRDFCGPICPEVAKLTRPQTLRAMFGKNKVMNAVHCTDLEEDTSLELEYIFKFLN
uniref:DM10 domain-containing protein n=1 Tax=Anopheles minimus TaxID=112268 RepID=A0A182VQR9_9DIPT